MVIVDNRPVTTFGALVIGDGFQIPGDGRVFAKVSDSTGGTANFMDFGTVATPTSSVNHLADAQPVVKVTLTLHIS